MNRIISIADFGAKADGTLQTECIQRAIDHCFLQGGGEVQIPTGEFYTGGLRLRSNVTLHLMENAILKGSRNPEDYFSYRSDSIEPIPASMLTDALCVLYSTIKGETAYDEDRSEYDFKRIVGSRWLNALIRALNADNIAVIGEKGSVLDGSNCYDSKGEEGYRGPHCIEMYYCNNITLTGYTIKDSANWAHSIYYSNNITVDHITVLAGHDGLDVAECNNVRIKNSRFYTGDDCIAGFANVNVWVQNCELNSACSAFRFGGTNIYIERCHIYGPCRYSSRGSLTEEEKKCGAPSLTSGHRHNMLSAFTYFADYSLPIEVQPGNIVISNCKIEDTDRFLHYNYSGNEMWQKNRPLQSIRFENVEATGICMPLVAYGDKKIPITLELENIKIAFQKDVKENSFMHLCNFKRATLQNVTIANFSGDSLIKTWSDGIIETSRVQCDLPESKYILYSEDPFTCQTI